MLLHASLAVLLAPIGPAPLTQQETVTLEASAPAPAAATSPVLTLSWPGLGAALADPRDAGLLRALQLADDRLVALAAAPDWDGPPPQMMRLVFDLLAAPLELTVGVSAQPDAGSPLAARLEVGGTPESVAALASRLPLLLGMLANGEGDVDPDRPGLKRLDTPAGPLRHGIPEHDRSRLVVLLGDAPALAAVPSAGRGSRAFALSFDARAAQPLLELARTQGGFVLQEILPMLEMVGLTGEDALHGWLELAHAADHASMSMRLDGLAAIFAEHGLAVPAPLDLNDLRRIPAGATYAQLGRQPLELTLRMMERMAAMDPDAPDLRAGFHEATGLDLEADLVTPLGDVIGMYLASETGGGFPSLAVLASVDDPERLASTLSTLAERVSEGLAGQAEGRVRIESWRPEELPRAVGWRLVFPQLPIPIQPTLLLSEGWLYASPFPGSTRTAALQGVAAGPGSSLPESPRFQQALATIGDRAPVSVQWSDTEAQLRGNFSYVQLAGTALDNLLLLPDGRPSGPTLPVVPPVDALVGEAVPALMLGIWDGETYVVEGVMDGSTLANAGGIAGSYLGLMIVFGVGNAVLLPNAMAGRAAAESARTQALASPLVEAIEAYAAENDGRWPTTLEELTTPDENGRRYLDAVPTDRWGRPLVYVPPTEDTPWPSVLSYGADGVEGGYGDDEDIYFY